MQIQVVAPVAFLDLTHAATFVGGISPELLRRSDCPRCTIGGRIVFFVGDLVHYVLARRQPLCYACHKRKTKAEQPCNSPFGKCLGTR